ncbi:MAG: helix-turn-helix transcriptional regulator [Lachnospiraceae bacterium]|nr:helix-turn-helix transcriptional regulator [Lachnospiraceae bacterium]
MDKLNLDYMGPMLKEARLKAKMTQDEVSERVGITTRYLMAIENEGKCPALDVWVRLIHTLHISANDIVYPENVAEKEVDEHLIYMIRLLNSRDKKITQTIIQTMLDNQ